MSYLDVRIDQLRDKRNRVHQILVEHDTYDRTRLLYRTAKGDTHGTVPRRRSARALRIGPRRGERSRRRCRLAGS